MKTCSYCKEDCNFHWDFDKDLWICKECYDALYKIRNAGFTKKDCDIYLLFWKHK